MSYTPVELRHVRVGRSLFGYNRAMVEQVIEEVADSFETAWRERGELTDKVDALEKQIVELKGREELLLTHTLVAAESAAAEVRAHAKREAEIILAEAHQEARSITRTAHSQRELLFAEARRMEALLRASLGMVQEGLAPEDTPEPATVNETEPVFAPPPAEPVPAPVEQPWPAEVVGESHGQETREFAPVALPPGQPAEDRVAMPAERPLTRVVGSESRDFDWGD